MLKKKLEISVGDLKLESGQTLSDVNITLTILGRPLGEGKPVVWISHGLTSGSDPSEWWPRIVGSSSLGANGNDDIPVDVEKYTVICCNILGSCYGSTGPESINPKSGKKYGNKFPLINYRDISKAYSIVAKKLGIHSIHMLIGGSIGGQQALQWACDIANKGSSLIIENLFLLATNAVHSPWGIAFNESQRLALEADPEFEKNGNPISGLIAARSVAMLSYRTPQSYNLLQPRDKTENTIERFPYAAASYQYYQGVKLSKRFSPFSYHTLLNLMDSHDLGSGSEAERERLLAKLQTRTTIIGIKSDLLFPIEEQRYLAKKINRCELIEIDSIYGHDGFLLENDIIGQIIKNKL